MPFLNSLYGVKKVRHTKSIYFTVPFIQLQNKTKKNKSVMTKSGSIVQD